MKTCGVSHGFAWLAQSTAPKVKVIYNVRNPLDIALSEMKYAQGHLSQELAHCEAGAGGAECRNAHLKAGTGLYVDIERTIQLLKWASQEEEATTRMLHVHGVDYIAVNYDKLFHNGEDVSEWRRIFKYLGEGTRHSSRATALISSLTPAVLQSAMGYAPTSSAHHSASIANYAELKVALAGTGFENLLH